MHVSRFEGVAKLWRLASPGKVDWCLQFWHRTPNFHIGRCPSGHFICCAALFLYHSVARKIRERLKNVLGPCRDSIRLISVCPLTLSLSSSLYSRIDHDQLPLPAHGYFGPFRKGPFSRAPGTEVSSRGTGRTALHNAERRTHGLLLKKKVILIASPTSQSISPRIT